MEFYTNQNSKEALKVEFNYRFNANYSQLTPANKTLVMKAVYSAIKSRLMEACKFLSESKKRSYKSETSAKYIIDNSYFVANSILMYLQTVEGDIREYSVVFVCNILNWGGSVDSFLTEMIKYQAGTIANGMLVVPDVTYTYVEPLDLGELIPLQKYFNQNLYNLILKEKEVSQLSHNTVIYIQKKQSVENVTKWFTIQTSAFGLPFQTAQIGGGSSELVTKAKELLNIFLYQFDTFDKNKEILSFDVAKAKAVCESSKSTVFNVTKYIELKALPTFLQTALKTVSIFGKVAIPLSAFLSIELQPLANEEFPQGQMFYFDSNDNIVDKSNAEKRAVITKVNDQSAYWDAYSKARIQEQNEQNQSDNTNQTDTEKKAEEERIARENEELRKKAVAKEAQEQRIRDAQEKAIDIQMKVGQAWSDFFTGGNDLGKNWASYYSQAQKVVGFDSKLKEYESLKITNGTQAVIDDLTKRELQKRVEFVETATGIYAGGKRLEGVIDGQGNISVGGQRTGVTITPTGISMSGTSTGTVTGEVTIKPGTEINVNPTALANAIAQNPISINPQAIQALVNGLQTTIQFNTNPLVDFATKEGIILNPKLIEGKSIDLRVPEGTQVNGNIKVNWGETPTINAKLEDTTLKLEETSVNKIADTIKEVDKNKADREKELVEAQKIGLANQKIIDDNTIKNQEKSNTLLENNLSISTTEKALREGEYEEGIGYITANHIAWRNLNSQSEFKTNEGITLKQGINANPYLKTQETYNNTILSEATIKGKQKFTEEFLPSFKQMIPETKEGTLKRFADVNPELRADFHNYISSIFVKREG